MAARIHAATHRLLTLIAEFDQRQGWKLGGHRSCAHWLSFCTGIDMGAAREKVRTARALVGLPETSASMARGHLSFSQARALTRRATAENEGELLKIAHTHTAAELERAVRAYPQGSRKDEAALERERYESRSLSVFPDYEGMYVVKGRLPAEVGALLMRAVEMASDELFREEPRGTVPGNDAARTKAATQRRADALGLLIERALAGGFEAGVEGADAESVPGDLEAADAEAENAAPGDANPAAVQGVGNADSGAPISSSRAERYQVMLHVEAGTLGAEGGPEAGSSPTRASRSELGDGTRVSAETSQRITCDCGLVKVTHLPDGTVMDVGRRTRTIPPALRRALEVRDRGCRFPGCGSRFTEGHHVVHWAQGGETNLGNTLLLCRHHHRLVHEGGWTVRWKRKEQPEFVSPRGRVQGGVCGPGG